MPVNTDISVNEDCHASEYCHAREYCLASEYCHASKDCYASKYCYANVPVQLGDRNAHMEIWLKVNCFVYEYLLYLETNMQAY